MRDYLISFYSAQGGVEFPYLTEQDYILAECRKCGLVYQVEIPNGALMQRIYDKWIDPVKVFELYERKRSIEYYERVALEVIEAVRYFKVHHSELVFLDYSMGWAHWCRVAQAVGCSVQGTEFSAARVNHAKRNGVPVLIGDSIPKDTYDFINLSHVLEHLPDPRGTLLQLK